MAATLPNLQQFESAASAAARLARIDLAAPALPVAAAYGADLAGAARALVAAGMTGDAVLVLGQALDKRAAVWWACRAARNEPAAAPEPAASGPAAGGLPPAEEAALAAAESWVREPDAAKAHAAFAAAEASGMASPAACAALAAFFAAESIAPIGGTAVPPPDYVAGLASAGAVQLATVRHRPDIAPQTLAAFVDRGFAIAAGKDPWEN
jgi:alkylhydroperoxidase family enzyme